MKNQDRAIAGRRPIGSHGPPAAGPSGHRAAGRGPAFSKTSQVATAALQSARRQCNLLLKREVILKIMLHNTCTMNVKE